MKRKHLGRCYICSKPASNSYETVPLPLEEMPEWLQKVWREKGWTTGTAEWYPPRHIFLCKRCAKDEEKLKRKHIKSVSFYSDGTLMKETKSDQD